MSYSCTLTKNIGCLRLARATAVKSVLIKAIGDPYQILKSTHYRGVQGRGGGFEIKAYLWFQHIL